MTVVDIKTLKPFVSTAGVVERGSLETYSVKCNDTGGCRTHETIAVELTIIIENAKAVCESVSRRK